MPRIPLDIPPGLFGDDTTFSVAGRWSSGSNVRFWRGRPQVIGGWESLVSTLLTGVCRTAFSWTDNLATLNIGFGTHSALQVFYGGSLYTITPTQAAPPIMLGANPLSVTNGSAVVTVAHPGHGLATGNSVVVAGATAVGGITPNGTFAITVVNPNTYTYTFGSPASGTATGGGSSVVIAPQVAFTAGAIDGTGGAGYGTGAYSVGGYSEPSINDYSPRTWSLAAWGQNLLASPRGGTIYGWTNNTGVPAAPLANAPRQVTHMLVAPQEFTFALGCTDEVTGLFDPLVIRHSSRRNNTEWNTGSATTARSYRLPGGGRIVAGRVIGNYLLVFTSDALFLGTYVGSLTQVWRFDRVGEHCGLIGPNAAVVVSQTAFWLGPDLQYYRYNLGGAPAAIECPIRNASIENLTTSQADKIVASSISIYQEVRFDYPDSRDGLENSRYVAVSLVDGAWYSGEMPRTAFVDANPAPYPIGCTAGGNAFYHERGQSADGSAFAWRIRSADQYISEENLMMVNGVWPDITDQVGPIWLTLTSKLKPQDQSPVTKGPYVLGVDDPKVDLRANGRLFNIEFSGNSAPTGMRMGKPIFDIQKSSGR